MAYMFAQYKKQDSPKLSIDRMRTPSAVFVRRHNSEHLSYWATHWIRMSKQHSIGRVFTIFRLASNTCLNLHLTRNDVV
jgi:hypothetical protein